MKNASTPQMHPQVLYRCTEQAFLAEITAMFTKVVISASGDNLSISSNRTHGSIDNARQRAREGNLNRGVHRL